jgi:hypothetical protein
MGTTNVQPPGARLQEDCKELRNALKGTRLEFTVLLVFALD